MDLKEMWVALGSGLHEEESRLDPCYKYIMNSWHMLLKTWIVNRRHIIGYFHFREVLDSLWVGLRFLAFSVGPLRDTHFSLF